MRSVSRSAVFGGITAALIPELPVVASRQIADASLSIWRIR